jgi:ATP:ADP antiporter, AAA family
MASLDRLFRIEGKERGLVYLLGFLLLSNSVAYQISGIIGISGFLSSGGVNSIPLVFLIDYSLILVVGILHSLVVDRFDRVTYMRAMAIGFACVFILVRVLFWLHAPDWLNYGLMYLIAEQQLVFFPLVFWVLAGDLFSMTQTKRLFPLISSGGFIGKLIGIAIAFVSPTVMQALKVGSQEIIFVNIFIYILIFVIILFQFKGRRETKKTQESESLRATLHEGWDFVKDVKSFRYLMVVILALALADTIIEFRFLGVTDLAFPDQYAYQQFYSAYRFGTTLLSFFLQMFLTGRLIEKLGLKNMFFFFPIIALLGSVSMMALPGISVAVTSMLLLKLMRETIDDSSRKAMCALVPEERRGRVSTFMASYLPSFGTILACLILIVIVGVGNFLGKDIHIVYLAMSGIASGVALYSAFQLRKVYDASLLNWRLKRRQRQTATVDLLSLRKSSNFPGDLDDLSSLPKNPNSNSPDDLNFDNLLSLRKKGNSSGDKK